MVFPFFEKWKRLFKSWNIFKNSDLSFQLPKPQYEPIKILKVNKEALKVWQRKAGEEKMRKKRVAKEDNESDGGE